MQKKKIVVIGAGVAGIVAAYVLSRVHDVTLIEKNDYLGGHTNTIVVPEGPDAGTPVDTGFIVCNRRNYPNFYTFLEQLGVSLLDSDMSFTFYCGDTGFGYSGPRARDFLRCPSNLLRPSFVKMVLEQQRFNRAALQALDNHTYQESALAEFVQQLGFSDFFIHNYLVPLAAAIWSSPDSSALDIPTGTFLRFFKNHGMLELHTIPDWQVVCGGSHAYIKAFRSGFRGRVETQSPVHGIRRQGGRVWVRKHEGSIEEYDAAILATHADQSLKLLSDPTPREQHLLASWRYQENSTILHTDTRLLPPRRSLWSSWNYVRHASRDLPNAVQVSYYMNRLQRLKTSADYVVSLNQDSEIDPSKVLYRTSYSHPQYNLNAIQSQSEIEKSNGDLSTYYCGSYLGYGFHEDVVSSALRVTSKFGLHL